MFTEYKIKWINGHIVIDNEQELLVDTGSPLSFHPTGKIELCGETISVPSSLANVTASYLESKVGQGVQGIVGCDIISKLPTSFNLHQHEPEFIFMDDDADYPLRIDGFSLFGLYGMYVFIDGIRRKMIFDTGAPYSYLNSELAGNKQPIRKARDFSPLFSADFDIDIVSAQTSIFENDKSFVFEYGVSPKIDVALQMLNVDGIIGNELLRHYRLQIKGYALKLPPQGI